MTRPCRATVYEVILILILFFSFVGRARTIPFICIIEGAAVRSARKLYTKVACTLSIHGWINGYDELISLVTGLHDFIRLSRRKL